MGYNRVLVYSSYLIHNDKEQRTKVRWHGLALLLTRSTNLYEQICMLAVRHVDRVKENIALCDYVKKTLGSF